MTARSISLFACENTNEVCTNPIWVGGDLRVGRLQQMARAFGVLVFAFIRLAERARHTPERKNPQQSWGPFVVRGMRFLSR